MKLKVRNERRRIQNLLKKFKKLYSNVHYWEDYTWNQVKLGLSPVLLYKFLNFFIIFYDVIIFLCA
jgi:hypothetical protein